MLALRGDGADVARNKKLRKKANTSITMQVILCRRHRNMEKKEYQVDFQN